MRGSDHHGSLSFDTLMFATELFRELFGEEPGELRNSEYDDRGLFEVASGRRDKIVQVVGQHVLRVVIPYEEHPERISEQLFSALKKARTRKLQVSFTFVRRYESLLKHDPSLDELEPTTEV
jgi:hypothetical protein